MSAADTIKHLLTKMRIFGDIAKLSLPIIIAISLIVWLIWDGQTASYIFIILFAIFLLLIIFVGVAGYREVEEGKVALVERLGHFNREIDPGPNWIIPIIESLAWVSIGKHRHEYIDMREQIHDIEAQNVFTKDKTTLLWKGILLRQE